MFKLFCLVITVGVAHCSTNGAPCSTVHSLKPDAGEHGPPQTETSPYGLLIYKDGDSSKAQVSSYKTCDTYIVQITGPTFQGLLLQARQVNSDGSVDQTHKIGQFVKDDSWADSGLKYQSCSTEESKDSVTHRNSHDKSNVSIKWQPKVGNGPVQFVMTIAKTKKTYWDNLQPASGKLDLDPSSAKGEQNCVV